MEEIKINAEYIKLGQLLKMSGICTSGIEAKIMILEGQVKVNDEVELRRGKKIYDGDRVKVQITDNEEDYKELKVISDIEK